MTVERIELAGPLAKPIFDWALSIILNQNVSGTNLFETNDGRVAVNRHFMGFDNCHQLFVSVKTDDGSHWTATLTIYLDTENVSLILAHGPDTSDGVCIKHVFDDDTCTRLRRIAGAVDPAAALAQIPSSWSAAFGQDASRKDHPVRAILVPDGLPENHVLRHLFEVGSFTGCGATYIDAIKSAAEYVLSIAGE